MKITIGSISVLLLLMFMPTGARCIAVGHLYSRNNSDISSIRRTNPELNTQFPITFDFELTALVDDSDDIDFSTDNPDNVKIFSEIFQAPKLHLSEYSIFRRLVYGLQHKEFFIAISDLPPPSVV
jgi:hypothetical protein